MKRNVNSPYHFKQKIKSAEHYSVEEVVEHYNKLVQEYNDKMLWMRQRDNYHKRTIEGIKDRVNRNSKIPKRLEIIYNMALIYAFLEKKKEELGFSRRYLRLMILLYQYDEIKMDDFASNHPEMMKYGWTLFESIRLMSKARLVIRHRYGKDSTTICLSMLGRNIIDNLNKEAKKFHKNATAKEISDLWN